MLNKILFILVIMSFFSCNHQKVSNNRNTSTEKSSKENALKIADNIIEKEGYDLSLLKREITEDNSTYTIKYSIKDSLIIGGGAKIILSKKDLKVIEKKFEQ